MESDDIRKLWSTKAYSVDAPHYVLLAKNLWKIKYLEIEKRYGDAVSGILKVNGSPLKENYWLRDVSWGP